MNNEEATGPKIWAGISMKVNIGNYENQDISLGISGIPYDAYKNPEMMQEILASGQLTIQSAMNVMAGEIQRILAVSYGR